MKKNLKSKAQRKRKFTSHSIYSNFHINTFQPMTELKIDGRTLWMMRPYKNPQYTTDVILTKSMFNFVYGWLLRNIDENSVDQKKALKYWLQAKSYYIEGVDIRSDVKPLLNYYCCLNTVKSMLCYLGEDVNNIHHGVDWISSESENLDDQRVKFWGAGALTLLRRKTWNGSDGGESEYSLKSLLSNLAFIHRAYTYTYDEVSDIFLPLKSIKFYKLEKVNKITLGFEVSKCKDLQTLKEAIPTGFEFTTHTSKEWDEIKSKTYDEKLQWGLDHGRLLFRLRKPEEWDDDADNNVKLNILIKIHEKVRKHFQYIAADTPIWYLKSRNAIDNGKILQYSSLSVSFAIMHCLSEMVRYKPDLYNSILESKYAWLITEFVELGIDQFIDEIASEITRLNILRSGVKGKR